MVSFPTIRPLFLAAAFATAGLAQEEVRLTPRQLFYQEPKPKAPVAKPQRVSRPRPSTPERPKGTPEAVSPGNAPSSSFEKVSIRQESPLVLRYSLLKRSANGKYEEVDPASPFHTGDQIRVRVESSDAAYLYISQLGSSGEGNVLFPSAEISGGNNRVDRLKPYDIPPAGGFFRMHDPAGVEKLFIILSRKPEQELQEIINRGSAPPSRPRQGATMARNEVTIDPSVMSRLQSRDLRFEKEKVDENATDAPAAASAMEKAMYVVNEARDPQAPVIVNLELKHE